MKKNNLNKKLSCFTIFLLFLFSSSFLMAQDCPINVVDDNAGTPGAGSQYSFTVADCADYAPGTVTFTTDGGGSYIVSACPNGTTTATFTTNNGVLDPLANGGIVATFSNGAGPCEYDTSGTLIEIEVPTLSEWGLLILALLFMTMGTLYLINNKVLALKE